MKADPSRQVVLLVFPDVAAKAVLQDTADVLDQFGVPWTWTEAEAPPTTGGRAVVVASADGEVPGRWSRETGLLTIRVPVEGKGRSGLALLDDGAGRLPAGMDGGVFATMAIGAAGARNAALFVVATLAVKDEALRGRWEAFREQQTTDVLAAPALILEDD